MDTTLNPGRIGMGSTAFLPPAGSAWHSIGQT
jgi:hypothetical protein